MSSFSLLLLSFSLVIALLPMHVSQAQSHLDIMSYNIRYDNPDDAPNHWDNRKTDVTNLIQFHEPVFLGTQEALFHQLNYLNQHLQNYEWIGRGRKDGEQGGEFSALFYDINKVQFISGSDSTIWLSETPDEPSKHWDAALPRVLTWGKFKIKATGDSIYVFNTHFDHVGKKARAESAKLILNTIEQVAGKAPVVLTGDFNIQNNSKPYQILTSTFLTDSYNVTQNPPVGPEYTFSGFNITPPDRKRRIDYIFINNGLVPHTYATISSHNGRYYPSDHLPIIVKAEVSPQHE